MPIPEEGVPQFDESVDQESNELEAAAQDPIEAEAEESELEFETADVDNNDDIVEIDEVDRDTASFGYGDPAD